jgi:Na+-driven multidrug efflux pump
MAVPLMLQNVFGYALSVIAAVAVGRLNDPTTLSAVVLAGSFYNVTGLSLIVGFSAGCDTIAGILVGVVVHVDGVQCTAVVTRLYCVSLRSSHLQMMMP